MFYLCSHLILDSWYLTGVWSRCILWTAALYLVSPPPQYFLDCLFRCKNNAKELEKMVVGRSYVLVGGVDKIDLYLGAAKAILWGKKC